MAVKRRKSTPKPKITSKPRVKQITTPEMEIAIAKYFGIRSHIIVPNLSWGFFNHECDLFLIRKSGYGFEVEIKRSRSDMIADLKKKRKHIDEKNRIAQLFYAFPKELLSKVEELVPKDCGILTVEKHLGWDNQTQTNVSMVRNAKRREGVKRLTQAEQLKIARLGCLRIIPLKAKLITLQNKL